MDRQQVFYEGLMKRSQEAFDEHATLMMYAAVLVTVVLVPLALRRPRRISPWVTTLLTVPIVYYSLQWAWELKWIADDAFISFRYAENLLAGNGLVLNPGEYVEGYTNFLWLMLLAATFELASSPLRAAAAAGFSGVTLASRPLDPDWREHWKRWFVGFAASPRPVEPATPWSLST